MNTAEGLAMRRKLAIGIIAGALVIAPGATAFAVGAGSDSGQNGTRFESINPLPDNGGDNGWGNCGHNSSKGKPHTGTNGAGGGNGGMRKSDCLAPAPTPEPSPTEPTPEPSPTEEPPILIG